MSDPSVKLREELSHRPLLGVLGAGIALRLFLLFFYSPGIIFSIDSARFARATPDFRGFFDDFWMPAGYAGYLSALRHISDQLWLPIALQHVLALATAIACFLALRQLGLPKNWATGAVAILLLVGDVVFLEHAMLADEAMLGLTVLACCAAIAGLVPRTDWRWLMLAGVLAAMAMLSRGVAIVEIAAIVLVALFAAGSTAKARLLAGGAVLAGALSILILYGAVFQISGGRYAGISDMTGWNLYARVAPFASCGVGFAPPKGTEQLCDPTAPGSRLGPGLYAWFGKNPSPAASKVRGKFAGAAIRGQPGLYAKAVATDLVRFVQPTVGEKPLAGTQRSWMAFDNATIDNALPGRDRASSYVKTRYKGVSNRRGGKDMLGVYQRVVRIHGWLLPFMLALALYGWLALDRRLRIAIALFGLSSVGLFVLPVMTFSYDYRYGVPPSALLAIAALVAGAGLLAKRRE